MKIIKNVQILLISVFLIFAFTGCKEDAKDNSSEATKSSEQASGEDVDEKKEEVKPVSADQIGYSFGVIIAKAVKEVGLELNSKEILKGYKAAMKEDFEVAGFMDAEMVLQQAYQEAHLKTVAKKLEDANKFLEENKKKNGVITTESGLQYEVLVEGDGGDKPTLSDTVEVNYTGYLMDGSVFDDSTKSGKPVEIQLNRVIPGWTEGLQLMTKGAKFKFYISPALAYGERGISQGGKSIIPPNEVLTFEVELVSIKVVRESPENE